MTKILIALLAVGSASFAVTGGVPASAERPHAQPHAILHAGIPTSVGANVSVTTKRGSPVGSQEAGQIADRLGTGTVGFVANVGQSDPVVRFFGAAPHAGFYASDRGMTIALGTDAATQTLTLRFLGGANLHPRITTSEPLAGSVNVLRGPQSKTGMARFRVLTYESVWPGIDVRFHAQGGVLKYEFVVAAGADPGRIDLAWDGAEALALAPDGALRLTTGHGPLTDQAPVSFQGREQVATRYVLRGGDRFRFKVGHYNHDRALVIDPGLLYWTFLGGTGYTDTGYSIAVDAAGAVYVTGTTASPDFPSYDQPKFAAGYDQTHNGHSDVFVVKLDPRGETLAYWTFLGGSGEEDARGIAIDAAGAAYVTGNTSSPDFPSVDRSRAAPGYDQTHNGQRDAFVVKLDPRGEAIAYWTFLGGTNEDSGMSIAVDVAGAAYVAGYTESADFPSAEQPAAAPGYDQTFNGSIDAFVVKLDPLGESLAYWTVLGGSNIDAAFAIAVDAAGAAYVTGRTESTDFPSANQSRVAPGYDQTYNGICDAFVVKLDPLGETLAYWTFLGGTFDDMGWGIGVDAQGSAYVTGYASSPEFPSVDQSTVAPGYDQTHSGIGLPPRIGAPFTDREAFVVKLGPSGATLEYWTFLGARGDDFGYGIAVDAAGAAYVTGFTRSPDFPSADQPKVAAGYDQTYNGNGDTTNGDSTNGDAFVVKLDPLGKTLANWTFLGGCCANNAYGYGIAVDVAGAAAYVTGQTESPVFPNIGQPTLSPGYDQTYNAAHDAFVVKLDMTRTQPNQTPVVTNPGPQSGFQTVGITLAISAVDADGDPLIWSAANLPPGVTINASSGLLSGTPTTIGVFTVVVSASDTSASAQASFTWSIVSPLPGAAVPLSPSASVATATPAFSWTADPLATYYWLLISDGSAGADAWYTPAQANCASGAGTCTVAAPHTLLPGLITWRVLTWNPYGYGPWSTSMRTVVDLSDPTAPTPTQSGPEGPIATRTPTYQWGSVDSANWYQLSFTDAAGAVREFWYAPAEACPAASCSVTPNILLPIGPANWKVRAWRAGGASAWSPSRNFEPADLAPGKATLVSPAAAVSSPVPSFTWNAVLGTSYYLLRVIDRDTTTYDRWYRPSDAACVLGTGACSASPGINIKAGRATWMVLTWNGSGYGPWSDPREFTVDISDASALTPTPVSPTSSISTANTTYRWTAVSGVLSYRLSVRNNGGAPAYWWFTPADAGCIAAGECAAMPLVGLQNGTAEWQMQAWTANGHGEWGSPTALTVSIPPPPAPTLVSPRGSTSGSPSFQWNASAGATFYYVRAYDPAGLRVDRWLTPTQAGCPSGLGICTLTASLTLNSGAGNWQVLAWNPTGYSPWSAAVAFAVP